MAEPEELRGGNSTAVERIGETVRRTSGPWTPTIHALLRTLRSNGVTEVPEPMGLDERSREVLSYLPGTVANYPLPDWLWSDSILEQAAHLLRRMHDATIDARFENAIWQLPSHEPQEVICHNDFAPYNLVFDRHHLVGVIDFDTASPGPRIWDFAYLAYRLVPFTEDAGPAAPQDDARMARLKLATRSYGTPFAARDVLHVMALRLDELAVFTVGRASATGNPEFEQHAAMYRRDAATLRAMIPTTQSE